MFQSGLGRTTMVGFACFANHLIQPSACYNFRVKIIPEHYYSSDLLIFTYYALSAENNFMTMKTHNNMYRHNTII